MSVVCGADVSAAWAARRALTTFKTKRVGAKKGSRRHGPAWLSLGSLLACSAKRATCCSPVCRATWTGYELLKKKADALKMRFQAMLKEIQKTKLAMSNEASEAFFSLTQAQYAAGDFRTKVIESVTTAEIRTMNRIDNVAGVKLPVFTEVEVSREKSENIGLAGGGGKIQNCREKFRVLLRALIKLASLQVPRACVCLSVCSVVVPNCAECARRRRS